ncbi:hypothetical protein QBC44DRAFT_162461 [Cladorrhinum sp. PSN332]|nr:hypothetical protein QBC44DRAFT_162461 [Cladorrhinum sp. PSN332]
MGEWGNSPAWGGIDFCRNSNVTRDLSNGLGDPKDNDTQTKVILGTGEMEGLGNGGFNRSSCHGLMRSGMCSSREVEGIGGGTHARPCSGRQRRRCWERRSPNQTCEKENKHLQPRNISTSPIGAGPPVSVFGSTPSNRRQSALIVGSERQEVPCLISDAPANIQITPIFPQSRPGITRAWTCVCVLDHPKCQARVTRTETVFCRHMAGREEILLILPCQPTMSTTRLGCMCQSWLRDGGRKGIDCGERPTLPPSSTKREAAKPHSPPLLPRRGLAEYSSRACSCLLTTPQYELVP